MCEPLLRGLLCFSRLGAENGFTPQAKGGLGETRRLHRYGLTRVEGQYAQCVRVLVQRTVQGTRVRFGAESGAVWEW